MIITIDSNILLSIFTKDQLYDRAAALLQEYSSNEYIINDCIYLELAVHFMNLDLLNRSLKTLEISLLTEEKKDYKQILTGWVHYLKGGKFHCPHCGKPSSPVCLKCRSAIKFRQRILTDFLIGGFAHANSDGILTFDTRYYKNYFPGLSIFN